MAINSILKNKVKLNFQKRKSLGNKAHRGKKQYHDEYVKLDAFTVFDLLQSAQGKYSTPATKLLHQMASSQWWTISAAIHEGGRDPKAPLHFTLALPNATAIHVNCRKLPVPGFAVTEISVHRKGVEIDIKDI